MYKKIAVAVALSPTCEALLAEAHRIQQLFDSELLLIHVGKFNEKEDQELRRIIRKVGIAEDHSAFLWKEGNTAEMILKACISEKVDLLIAGALKKENLYRYYMGSIARRILRKADCSVLMLVKPSRKPKPFRRIVIQAGNDVVPAHALIDGLELGKKEKAWVHIVREVPLYGLSMSIASEGSEQEYGEIKKRLVSHELHEVESKLEHIDTRGARVNIKVGAGRPGHVVAEYAEKNNADLLIMRGLERKLDLLDRFLRRDLEYIIANLPTNLLIVH
ncbi:MAG: universal stress protein [Cytophagales bacterium]|nr:universal stress protein [Cytophagales bacterium]